MAEIISRSSARGRGSTRARGGFRGRGGRTQSNGDKLPDHAEEKDEGEVGQLKKQYGSKVKTIQELFPNWTDEDVVYAIQECDGDLDLTVDKITEGTISQWGEVSKSKKDRSRSKVKEPTSTAFTEVANQSKGGRGGRGGHESGRGRSRGADRGRGGRSRGASSVPLANGRKENELSVPTAESNAWESNANDDSWVTAKPADDSWADATATVDVPPAKAASSIIPDGVKKSWASMFAPAPALKKASEPKERVSDQTQMAEHVTHPAPDLHASATQNIPGFSSELVTAQTPPVEEPAVSLTPSKDELTETNLEQVPDVSQPAPTATAASTAASSWDPRTAAGNLTPYSTLQHGQSSASRPPTSGYQASALKATGVSGRTPSFQRRMLDQEEAVRMPGNREVDRAAVQFGAFKINGANEEDVDGDREEPETRTQPPQHSPVAHPRAALPPVPQQSASTSDSLSTPKVSTGLPSTATQQTATSGLPSPQNLPQASSAVQTTQASAQFGQYNRYGQPGAPEQQTSLPQKPYDPFSQQAPSSQSPFEGHQGQQSQSQQPPAQSSAFSSAPSDYSTYYTSDPHQRNAYNNYYQQQYGMQHQGAQAQQDTTTNQSRSYSGYNGSQSEASQYPQGQNAVQQTQGRYGPAGDSQNSGNSTPNQASQVNQGQQGNGQSVQPQAAHSQQPQGPNYPYNHPYYSSPYYASYMNQYQGYGGGGQYGTGPYGGKGGLHNQPYQGYAMSPQAPYDHASSPAGTSGFGASSLHARDGTLSGSLSEYGRAGSAQSSHGPQGIAASSAFGNVHESFGRAGSFQGQNQHFGTQQGGQPSGGDDLKPFGDSKTGNGPSPSITQAGRPGSAANTASGSALPASQSQQSGYAGYPAHLQQQGHGFHSNQSSSQYAGLGGAGVGSHQAGGQGHQNSQYGGGYQGFGGNNYYGNNQQRGGWGGNYGH